MDVVRLDEISGMRFPAGRHTRVLAGEGGLNAESFCQGYVVIPPGAGVPEHSHPQEEVYLILSGAGEMTVDGETRPVDGVCAIYVPSGLPHKLVNSGEEEMVMVFTYAPAGTVGHWEEELAGRLVSSP
jgi:mannose-6-phosphate isomerase-like protein (cupin superfamily)